MKFVIPLNNCKTHFSYYKYLKIYFFDRWNLEQGQYYLFLVVRSTCFSSGIFINSSMAECMGFSGYLVHKDVFSVLSTVDPQQSSCDKSFQLTCKDSFEILSCMYPWFVKKQSEKKYLIIVLKSEYTERILNNHCILCIV